MFNIHEIDPMEPNASFRMIASKEVHIQTSDPVIHFTSDTLAFGIGLTQDKIGLWHYRLGRYSEIEVYPSALQQVRVPSNRQSSA